MSSRTRRRRAPTISSYIGLIRFYEEVEEQIKLHPYLILMITLLTSLIVILAHILT